MADGDIDPKRLDLATAPRRRRVRAKPEPSGALQADKPKALARALRRPVTPGIMFENAGGDNYDALGGGTDKQDSGLVIRGAMEAYVRDHCKGGQALKVVLDGRITSTGGR